jgi:hypothetical protein
LALTLAAGALAAGLLAATAALAAGLGLLAAGALATGEVELTEILAELELTAPDGAPPQATSSTGTQIGTTARKWANRITTHSSSG